jgi:hypothetical protein
MSATSRIHRRLRMSRIACAPQIVCAVLCAWAAMASADVWAQDAAGQGTAAENQAVVDGGEALAGGDFPWYDSQTDSLKPIELKVEDIEEEPTRRGSLNLGPAFEIFVWTVLGLVLAAVVVLLILFARNQTRAPKIERVETDEILEPDQVEALPFLAERPRGDLLGQARRHYEAGNYSEAIIYLFSYELLALDKFSLIQLTKGKTNRQYLREVDRDAPVRSPLERTLIAFEGVFFGRRALDRAGFEACWNELPIFEQQLRAPS